jgi:hypothetical protein
MDLTTAAIAYELHAPPVSFMSFLSALASWSIYPVYFILT